MDRVSLQDNFFNVSLDCNSQMCADDHDNPNDILREKQLFLSMMLKKFNGADCSSELEKFNRRNKKKVSKEFMICDRIAFLQQHYVYSLEISKWRESSLKNCRLKFRIGNPYLRKASKVSNAVQEWSKDRLGIALFNLEASTEIVKHDEINWKDIEHPKGFTVNVKLSATSNHFSAFGHDLHFIIDFFDEKNEIFRSFSFPVSF